MKNEELQIFLRLAISKIQLECIKVEIDFPSAQYSDPERQGMMAAYRDASGALGSILEDKPIKPSFTKLLDGWFDRLYGLKERPVTPFEIGYARALRNSLGDMENLLDE